ncbi:CU044_5270 family protein [Streptosporangium sp. NPDC051022]|uniref:CU044_5270 family protein n=1 Tax=Streptosporangium sp. NPDC051022 TaxID=3155752 RepID=UPI00341E002A
MNAEIEDLARMLPAGEPELSPMRHRQLKNHFEREITRSRTRPRIRLLSLLTPVAAAGAVALVVGFQALGGGTDAPTEKIAYVPAPIIKVQRATTGDVAATLNRIADAAAREPAVAIRPDQYVYTESMVTSTRPEQQKTFDGPVELIALHKRRTWIPQDVAEEGLIRENGRDIPLSLAGDGLNYERLAQLPTDPAALLEWLYARQEDRDPLRAFSQIQGLMSETVIPPATRAALYRATALIPGVRLVPASVDAADREGMAVAFDADGERVEWIFDKGTLAFLGTRDYLIADSGRGKAGTLLSSSAVVTQKVTDQAGDPGSE